MEDLKEQLNLANKVIDKVVNTISVHGERHLEAQFGFDSKLANDLIVAEQKWLSQFEDPLHPPREAVIEYYKSTFRKLGIPEDRAEYAADAFINSNALSNITSRISTQ